ncbi:molybdenum cofactor biosynthesis protein MoaE [Pullulanibacillus sp. KACC 23026]|uniref:molybdenum cofactor biosynthesis protein MoaE n=1 Tax=Pullulanibacillus sp. KACC 23026 TaxID=3028315 RepID=UPI0023B00AB8|nr:molybdenum cofactor biosynthesis protein MoaE [Pullulanibacillus sp. KACC 23026]WEG11936.1 molybdenum cofactor biosynthesis protein MoaE [Pullulanibacillus sp. KACC 23026]
MSLFEIIEGPIDVQAVIDQVADRNAGAINTFIGTVREMTHDKRTVYLKYEAYVPMAVKQLERIGYEIQEKWDGTRVAITHRIGELQISDIAVVIAVSSPHRAAAFEACRYAIERIKEIVPIWKKEHWDNGVAWIGNQKETMSYENGVPRKEGDV